MRGSATAGAGAVRCCCVRGAPNDSEVGVAGFEDIMAMTLADEGGTMPVSNGTTMRGGTNMGRREPAELPPPLLPPLPLLPKKPPAPGPPEAGSDPRGVPPLPPLELAAAAVVAACGVGGSTCSVNLGSCVGDPEDEEGLTCSMRWRGVHEAEPPVNEVCVADSSELPAPPPLPPHPPPPLLLAHSTRGSMPPMPTMPRRCCWSRSSAEGEEGVAEVEEEAVVQAEVAAAGGPVETGGCVCGCGCVCACATGGTSEGRLALSCACALSTSERLGFVTAAVTEAAKFS